MRNSELVATCMAVISHVKDIAVEIAKKDGVDERDILRLCASAALCGSDATLSDMLILSTDDALDSVVRKAYERSKKHGDEEV